ncbi:MFS transporter [Bifidobacterium sp. SMB2]|uniref:MFS transporter n=1 Tax=Bifidobacterium saimiriisciurei TaxID=2661627 RepID=A0ABX0CF62_9BIFI|nr:MULTISPECIES: MFS transporter [Bifidobacterium]NEG95191.1 MFS transporter [Bifidobacterium sp. SMB2]NEH11268.1 MFS transporter [Bifidobacterium saimiriisciurei]
MTSDITPVAAGKAVNKAVEKARYIAGFIAYQMLNNIAFYIIVSILIPQRLKDLGVANPTAVLGAINGIGAILSLFFNVFFGAMSDRTRSRFGRRSPWILSGMVLYGVCFWIISLPTTGLTIGIAYCCAMFGLNMALAPLTAILSDRVDEGSRATVSAAFGGGAVIGQGIGGLIGSFFITRTQLGFVVAALFAASAGILSVLLMPKDPSTKEMPRADIPAWRVILEAFRPPLKNAGDFYKAFVCRTCLIVAYQMVTSFQLYILQDHIGQSKVESAATIQIISLITMIVSIVAPFLSGPISDIIKRRKPLILFSCGLYAVGLAMPWIFPSRMGMLLFAGIAGFGYGIYMAVDQALNVDVLPDKENAGKDLGFLNVATCAGQAMGSAITSTLITMTGSYNTVFPVAIAISLIAGISVLTIKRVK